MSVLRQPPRELRFFLIAVLCLVFTCTLFAQSEVMPVSTSESVVNGDNSAPVTNSTESDEGNKAISVEVSPADEVIEKTNESPVIVMPEVIPQSNEIKQSLESVVNKVESVKESIKEEVTSTNKTVSEAIKETAPIIISNEKAETSQLATPLENKANNEEKVIEKEAVTTTNPVNEVKEISIQKQDSVVTNAESNQTPIAQPKESTETSIQKQNSVVANSEPNKTPNAQPKAIDKSSNDGKKEQSNIFDSSRGMTLAVILVLLVFVSYYTLQAQRGKEMFIRRISGLSAIEDAVGRATEMGRGVLYVPGIMDMDDIQTIAGVTILGHVARKTAEYDTDLYAPMTRSFVMSVAQEVVKQAYMEKGRVDAYRPDRINYLTDDQFGYVAGVGGVMLRDKPAACFYLGTFYAESLILAETGNSIGAIQIAGTAEPSQIPFFVAACDYTLIGEELFAASAYLSKNPREIGSLKGQDMVKVIIIMAIIVGTLLSTLGATSFGKKLGFDTAANSFINLLK